MQAIVAGLGVALATFAGGLVGWAVRRAHPERDVSESLRDMIGAIGGLLSLLTALVLGLLIWQSYGVYSGQLSAVRTLATEFLELDQALADYGPEAAHGRVQLKDDLERLVEDIWGSDQNFAARNFGATVANWHIRQQYLRSLQPATDAQKQALAAANVDADAIARTRLQMVVALTQPVSGPLVVVVVAWAVLIFIGHGLMHARTFDSLVAMAVGSLAVASAVYLLIDLSHPYFGLVDVSPAPIFDVLALMGK